MHQATVRVHHGLTWYYGDEHRLERVANGLVALVWADSRVGRCDARADGLAVWVEALAEIYFDTIIDDPVVTAVRINPDTCNEV